MHEFIQTPRQPISTTLQPLTMLIRFQFNLHVDSSLVNLIVVTKYHEACQKFQAFFFKRRRSSFDLVMKLNLHKCIFLVLGLYVQYT